ncbi:MAG TPA: DUF3322 domain-containing protein [Xanthobacteraceae bacterium]|jgi:hypothetical protein|nr:DUF3322 domain-containing protein [Xanthobacteraceae bacterium]
MADHNWTTPSSLRDQVMHVWERGKILAACVTNETLFPLKLSLRCPDAKAMTQSFDAVRGWIRELEENSRSSKGYGYEIEWAEINHRQLGRNRMPGRIVVPTEHDALRLIGKERAGRRFRELAGVTAARFPALLQWVSRRPFVLIERADEWLRLLDVLAWFRDHPRSNLYLRQVDIAGVDTKFIEARKALLSELLDVVLLPPCRPRQAGAIAHDPAPSSRFPLMGEGRGGGGEEGDDVICYHSAPAGEGREGALIRAAAQTFEQKYGLRAKPPIIRFRALDRRLAIAGLTDLAIPANDFAALNLAPRRVFITENEVNGVAFPDFAEAVVVFGLGYGVELLQSASWMMQVQIYYWGDIDTHGFAMLDRLRGVFPGARSLLMNRETLMAHRSLWVREHAPYRAPLSRLDEHEQALFDDLVYNRLGEKVRLEQERVSYAFLERSLETIAHYASSGRASPGVSP